MDGAFHYRQSERLISMVENLSGSETKDEIAALLWLAHIHSQLAGAAALIEQASPGFRWRDALAARLAPEQGDQVAPQAGSPQTETTTTTTTTSKPKRRRASRAKPTP